MRAGRWEGVASSKNKEQGTLVYTVFGQAAAAATWCSGVTGGRPSDRSWPQEGRDDPQKYEKPT